MQLLRLNTTMDCTIQGVLQPSQFKELTVDGGKGKERHIEELIIRYPALLNYGGFSADEQSDADLLIISRQPKTSSGKRADLLAIHREGDLVVTEVKRDASDEAGRSEGMEFQAIRYAAACRKMTAEGVVDTFKEYLKQSIEATTPQHGTATDDEHWRKLAVKKLCEHLEDETEDLEEDDLADRIDPKQKQRIYLVAAGFSPESLAACAWLREKQIDISCFCLRPYQIGTETILQLDRLIPPPALDDFMTDSISVSSSGTLAGKSGTRSPGNKPTRLVWNGHEEKPVHVNSWKASFEQVIQRCLELGLVPQELPVKVSDKPEEMYNPAHFPSHGVFVDLHGSAASIQSWTEDLLSKLRKKGSDIALTIETKNGSKFEF